MSYFDDMFDDTRPKRRRKHYPSKSSFFEDDFEDDLPDWDEFSENISPFTRKKRNKKKGFFRPTVEGDDTFDDASDDMFDMIEDFFQDSLESEKFRTSNYFGGLGAEELGEFGEDLTELALTRVDGNHQVLRNLYVPYKGNTAEIDLVMAHEKGIFVFESKNYSGWIFGSAQQEHWTQSLPNGEKHSFYNPILQNAAHIAALSEYLKIPRKEFFSYIVFSERCSLKKTPPNTPSVAVLNRDALPVHLNAVLSMLPPIYNPAVVQSIADILRPLAVQDEETKAKHAETARAAKERAQNSAVCPLCGGTLVKRRGRYGEFWGCSSYPNCRFTRNIERV